MINGTGVDSMSFGFNPSFNVDPKSALKDAVKLTGILQLVISRDG